MSALADPEKAVADAKAKAYDLAGDTMDFTTRVELDDKYVIQNNINKSNYKGMPVSTWKIKLKIPLLGGKWYKKKFAEAKKIKWWHLEYKRTDNAQEKAFFCYEHNYKGEDKPRMTQLCEDYERHVTAAEKSQFEPGTPEQFAGFSDISLWHSQLFCSWARGNGQLYVDAAGREAMANNSYAELERIRNNRGVGVSFKGNGLGCHCEPVEGEEGVFELSISQVKNFDFVNYPACTRLEDVYTTLMEVAAQVIHWEKQMEVQKDFKPSYEDVLATNAYIEQWKKVRPRSGDETVGKDELVAQREFTIIN
jgi:hypothetical protein